MRKEDSEFSSLRTVASFDRGEPCTLALDVTPQELQRFSPSSLLVESLIEQICSLMEKNPQDQRKLYLAVCEKLYQMNLVGESYQREEFQFMRSHYQKALYQLVTAAKITSSDNKSLVPRTSTPSTGGGPIEWSRYKTEFIELEYIAKGGFGHVYKAQHKLDGGIYAVKKIFLRYHSVDDFLRNLREVKMLARLNHPNIVSYKAAWLEAEQKCFFSSRHTFVDSFEVKEPTFDTKSSNDSSIEVIFEDSSKSGSNALEPSSVPSRSTTSPSSATKETTAESMRVCHVEKKQNYQLKFSRGDSRVTQSFNQTAVLYIQMQLCQKTLRQWLDERNESVTLAELDEAQCLDLFIKIVRGVEYIHSEGIVHHDIKPSNIFVSDGLKDVQVGDFGLSCCLLAHPNSSALSVVTNHQPGPLGTKLYAAPEQLRGTCHPKSDVYSLGIVLMELILPFCTAMERSKTIALLKSGHIPTELAANFPSLAKIISLTVTPDLMNRSTSSELLTCLEAEQLKLKDTKDGGLTRSNALKIVQEQSETIKRLRRESLAKDEEIAQLKRQLWELSKK